MWSSSIDAGWGFKICATRDQSRFCAETEGLFDGSERRERLSSTRASKMFMDSAQHSRVLGGLMKGLRIYVCLLRSGGSDWQCVLSSWWAWLEDISARFLIRLWI